jgi:hypothetical protein
MGFTLEVTFTGMCFFVPDRQASSGPRLHVLLPRTTGGAATHGGHGGEDEHRHYPMLRYPAHHKDKDEDPAAGQTLVTHDFEGWEVDLPAGEPTAGLSPELPRVADLGRLGGFEIDRNQLGDTPRSSVVARVRVPWWTGAAAGDGGRWKFEHSKDELELTNQVTLTIPQPGKKLELVLRPLSTGLWPTPLTLVPRNEVVKLEIRHAPKKDPKPELGYRAEHFAVYYTLFEKPITGPDVPTLVSIPPIEEDPEWGGRPYTCLVAGAPPEP